MSFTDWISSVWDRSGVWGIICILLSFISLCNISVAIFITMLRIEKIDNTPKKIATALYFAFTLLGLYAAKQLLF